MSDDETKPEPYPDHDTAWRSQKTEAKHAIKTVLSDYDPAVALAAVSEVAADRAHRWGRHDFSERHEDSERND